MDDLERTNYELTASNEELLSMNEELRSANEELQTSQEQTQVSNRALADANTDLENLMRSTHIATVFLDSERIIRGFTPAATDLYGIIPSDIGRPLDQLKPIYEPAHPLPSDEELHQATGPIESSVGAGGNRWFIRRVLPYYRQDKTVDGLVITFSEVTRLRESEAHLRRIIDNMLGFVGVLTPAGDLVEVNEAALYAGGLNRSDAIGKKFWDCYWWNHDEKTVEHLKQAFARAERARWSATTRSFASAAIGESGST